MTDCTNVVMRERLPELLHDALDGETQAAVQAHLGGCATCAAELALLREARRVLSRAPAIDVARIVAALPAPPAAGTPRLHVSRGGTAMPTASAGRAVRARGGVRWRRVAVAAGLLLAAGVSGLTLSRLGGDAASGVVAVQATSEAVSSGAGGDARLLAVNVVGLTEDDFAGLLADLDDLEALPASDPRPMVPVESRLGSEGSD